MKKILTLFILLIISSFILTGCGFQTTTEINAPIINQPVKLSPEQTITLNGENNKTALEILQSTYQVETKTYENMGEFIETINGLKPDNKHFWAFYINGQMAEVGAGQYQSKDGDVLEFKLEEIK
jgi:outer membrane lipopolysaccharide assembly protein LptE/RlpB